jgi:hypothetical protein
MEEDKYYQNIQKALEDLPENFSILEEQIDIDVQMKYFEYTKEAARKDNAEDCFARREELFDEAVVEERKKEILTGIAVYDDVKAYRTLEKFVQEADGPLKQWGILALQESRMLMQSSLLDEQQVFISTGLGGKGQKLRYFVVFLSEDEEELLNETQQKLLKDELIFELKKHDGIFETMDFMEGFSSTLVLLPLNVEIKSVFLDVIKECNQYGGFLQEDLIITNVKVLSRGEIIQMIHQKKTKDSDELDEE